MLKIALTFFPGYCCLLYTSFDSVKTGAEVKLPLSLLFEGKALTLLQKYQGKWSSFFSIKNKMCIRDS